MTELTEEVKTVREDKEKMEQMIAYIKDTMVIKIKEEEVKTVAALALAMKESGRDMDVRQLRSSAGMRFRQKLELCHVQQMRFSMSRAFR